MRLRLLNPWLIVGWRYCEKDEHGLLLLKAEGTTYFWRAIATYCALLAINILIRWTGVDHPKSEYFIVDGA